MDFKTSMLRVQRAIGENHAIAALAVVIGIAVLFLIILLVDAWFKWRRLKKHR